MIRPPLPANDANGEDDVEFVPVHRPRGLDTRPGLRCLAALLWTSFMGATIAMIVILVLPEGWLDPPLTFERLAACFALLWSLALLPAVGMALLATRPPRPGNSDAT